MGVEGVLLRLAQGGLTIRKILISCQLISEEKPSHSVGMCSVASHFQYGSPECLSWLKKSLICTRPCYFRGKDIPDANTFTTPRCIVCKNGERTGDPKGGGFPVRWDGQALTGDQTQVASNSCVPLSSISAENCQLPHVTTLPLSMLFVC